MRSTFTGLETAKRSLFAQQTALQTTAHNIANASTKGYTRQVVNLTASMPMEAVGLMRDNVPGQIGTGVEFDSIKRIRESFLDDQFHKENHELGSWAVRKDTLEKLQTITNEPSNTGLREVIEKFWSAWQTVSTEPENTTARAALKENAVAMTSSLNHVSKQLTDLKSDINSNLNMKANEANTILSQVNLLNSKIASVEGLGDNANDLRDQRDLLTDNLSKIVNITVSDSSLGYTIKMGNTKLVDGPTLVTNFATSPPLADNGSGVTLLSFEDAFKSGDLQSGETYGMIISRDNYLSSYKFQLDSMVKSLVEGTVNITMPSGSVLPPKLPPGTIIDGVTYDGTETLTEAQRVLIKDKQITVKGLNGLTMLGYTLETPPQSNVPFFTLKAGATEFDAASIQVNPNIVAKVGMIPSSARVLIDAKNHIVLDGNGKETLVKGNNTIALLTAGLKNMKFDFDKTAQGIPILNNGTFDEFYRAIVGQLGVQSQEANRQVINQQALVDQVDSNRQAVSGVSLDEEMANMIKFQHSYSASARMMTTFDQLLDKVINSMGLVGR